MYIDILEEFQIFQNYCLKKSGLTTKDIRYIFAGDLLGQLIASSFGLMDFEIPFFLTSPTTQQLFKSFEMFVEQLVEQYKGYVELERRQKDDNRD